MVYADGVQAHSIGQYLDVVDVDRVQAHNYIIGQYCILIYGYQQRNLNRLYTVVPPASLVSRC